MQDEFHHTIQVKSGSKVFVSKDLEIQTPMKSTPGKWRATRLQFPKSGNVDKFYGKSFLTLVDFNKDEICTLLDLSHCLKNRKKNGKCLGMRGSSCEGRNFILVFEKDSTRTRCAFEVAIADEGGHSTFLSSSHMGKKESIEDTSKVLGGMYDGVAYRGAAQDTVQQLAAHSGVPVWNALTDDFHPTQVLADMMTVMEATTRGPGYLRLPAADFGWGRVNLVYVGDGRNNMANSLMIICAKLGANFRCLSPRSLWPNEALVDEMRTLCQTSGGSICLFEIAEKSAAMCDASVVYTDVWASMGEDSMLDQRVQLLKDYQVDAALMELANQSAIFLHCLPAFHDSKTAMGKFAATEFGLPNGMEVTDTVFRSSQSRVFQQSENRVYTIRAVIVATAGKFRPNDDLDQISPVQSGEITPQTDDE